MEQKKWWDNPTAAVGALMGDKAQAMAEYQITKKLQAEYERGLQEGKKSAVVHAHWEVEGETPFCSVCGSNPEGFFDTDGWDVVIMNHGNGAPKYCPNCGAKMDEV